MGPAWPCGTGGPAGGRAGAARDAQTRGHYFCSEPRTALRPGPLIKPPRSRPPRPVRMRSTCVGPARAPAPARPAPPGRPGRGLGRPPGAGLQDGGGRSQRLGGRRPTPERAAHLVTLLKSLIFSGASLPPPPIRTGRYLQAPATRRRGVLSVAPRVHAPVLPRTLPGWEPALCAEALALAPAPGTPRSAAQRAGKGNASGGFRKVPKTPGVLFGPQFPGGNRFQRPCRTVIRSFR